MAFATGSPGFQQQAQRQNNNYQQQSSGQQQNYSAYNQDAQQRWQQSLNAWQMPRQELMQWGQQNGATYQTPGTQQQTSQRAPFQQTVQSPFGSQGNWQQGRDAFMAAGMNQASTNPYGYSSTPQQRNADWSPQNLMNQGQTLLNQGWTNPFAMPGVQIPQYDPSNFQMPLFGAGGWNIGQGQQQAQYGPQLPGPPSNYGQSIGGRSGVLPPQTGGQTPSTNSQAISQLFQNAGFNAPSGFIDQLISLLGGNATPSALPQQGGGEPPEMYPGGSRFNPQTPQQGGGMTDPYGRPLRVFYDDQGNPMVSGESLAGPGEAGRTVMIPMGEYQDRASRIRGATPPTPQQGSGQSASGYGERLQNPGGRYQTIFMDADGDGVDDGNQRGPGGRDEFKDWLANRNRKPQGSSSGVDPGRAQSIPEPSQGSRYGEVKKKEEEDDDLNIPWNEDVAALDREALLPADDILTGWVKPERDPRLPPAPMAGGFTWDALEGYWTDENLLTEYEQQLVALPPHLANILAHKAHYNDAIKKAATAKRWQGDPGYMRKLHQQNHAMTYGTDQRRSEIAGQIASEKAAGARPAAPDPTQVLYGGYEDFTLARRKVQEIADREGIHFDEALSLAYPEYADAMEPFLEGRRERRAKEAELFARNKKQRADERGAYAATGVLPAPIQRLDRKGQLKWLDLDKDPETRSAERAARTKERDAAAADFLSKRGLNLTWDGSRFKNASASGKWLTDYNLSNVFREFQNTLTPDQLAWWSLDWDLQNNR